MVSYLESVWTYYKQNPLLGSLWIGALFLLCRALLAVVDAMGRAYVTHVLRDAAEEYITDLLKGRLGDVIEEQVKARTATLYRANTDQMQSLAATLKQQADARVTEQHQALARQAQEQLHETLRQLVLGVKQSGIPLQVTVTSRKEADLLREALGPIPVRISRRPRKGDENVLPLPPPSPDGAPRDVWTRLIADDAEEPEEP